MGWGDGYLVRANTLGGVVEAGRDTEILRRSLFRVERDVAGRGSGSQDLFERATRRAGTVNRVVCFLSGVRGRPGKMDVSRS